MKKRKLKVFEAFAGIGAQHSALERAHLNYEIVGISEWFINALLAYDAIHSDSRETINIPPYEEQIKYLKRFTFSKDSVNPIKDISKLTRNEIEQLYVVNKRVKNYGSITEIQGKDMPRCDLLVYSFPCQDLSTGGKTLGMKKGSGTRSGLLWEIERVLKQLKEIDKLPEYLLMENVKAIYAPSNKEDLDQWLNFLESIGYKNGTKMVLNSKNFGIPQDRNRAFIISRFGKPVSDKKLLDYHTRVDSISSFLRTDYDKNPIFREEANKAQLNSTVSRDKMWKINEHNPNSPTVNTITCNMDRNNTAAMFKYQGPKGDTFRLLTIREAFLLMGFTEEEYERTLRLDLSYRKMNKLIGNSIVVNVLQAIFEVLFKSRYGRDD